jgi:TatA/E family protein of Tat protein translocase
MFEGLFQPMHLLIVAGIALLIFGPKKLPELGKGMGEGIRGFKAAMQGKKSRRHWRRRRKRRRKNYELVGNVVSGIAGPGYFWAQEAG